MGLTAPTTLLQQSFENRRKLQQTRILKARRALDELETHTPNALGSPPRKVRGLTRVKEEKQEVATQSLVSGIRRPRCSAHGTQVKRESCSSEYHAPRLKKAAAKALAPNRALEHVSTVDFELQERGKICLGLLLTREGD